MLGEIIPSGDINLNGGVGPTKEISWPSLAEGEEGADINWSPLAAGEKGRVKINAIHTFSPVGLKVLVVDDNRVCLAVLEKMLNRFTKCNCAPMALLLVQDKSNPFDLALCECICQLMSSNDRTDVVKVYNHHPLQPLSFLVYEKHATMLSEVFADKLASE